MSRAFKAALYKNSITHNCSNNTFHQLEGIYELHNSSFTTMLMHTYRSRYMPVSPLTYGRTNSFAGPCKATQSVNNLKIVRGTINFMHILYGSMSNYLR